MLKFLVLFLCFQVGSPEAPFKDRLEAALNSNKPILTIFSAKWCIPCQEMKRAVIEPMRASGELDSVFLIYVDIDKDKEFTKKQLGENFKIPRTLLFFQEDRKWLKYELDGFQPREKILQIIDLQRKRIK